MNSTAMKSSKLKLRSILKSKLTQSETTFPYSNQELLDEIIKRRSFNWKDASKIEIDKERILAYKPIR